MTQFPKQNVGDTSTGRFIELELVKVELDELRMRLANSTAADQTHELAPEESIRLAKEIVRSRRRRDVMFGQDLFGEPAWDLLLELYVAEQAQRRVCITRACEASAVPMTTALRWIERLEASGWVVRKADPTDKRRNWVSLTDHGSTVMGEYLASMSVRAA